MIKSKDFTMALINWERAHVLSCLDDRTPMLRQSLLCKWEDGIVLGKLIWIIQKMRDKTVRVLCKPIQKNWGEGTDPPCSSPPPCAYGLIFCTEEKATNVKQLSSSKQFKGCFENWGKHQNNEKFNF